MQPAVLVVGAQGAVLGDGKAAFVIGSCYIVPVLVSYLHNAYIAYCFGCLSVFGKGSMIICVGNKTRRLVAVFCGFNACRRVSYFFFACQTLVIGNHLIYRFQFSVGQLSRCGFQ